MLPSVSAEIAVAGFLDQSQSLLANILQFGERGLLLAQELKIYWYWRLQANESSFHKREWQVKSLQKRDVLRLFAEDSVGRSNDHAFYGDYVCQNFSGGPAAFPRPRFPLFGGNRIGGTQQTGLRAG